MLPADRNSDVVEPFRVHDTQVIGRVVAAPVLSRRGFEPVAQVGSAEEAPGSEVSGRCATGDRLHVAKVADPDRASAAAGS